jgi:hypothetical protein
MPIQVNNVNNVVIFPRVKTLSAAGHPFLMRQLLTKLTTRFTAYHSTEW